MMQNADISFAKISRLFLYIGKTNLQPTHQPGHVVYVLGITKNEVLVLKLYVICPSASGMFGGL